MYLKTLTQKNKSDGHVRKYLQIVESRRVNGSPRQKVLLSLGRVDTPEGKKLLESLAEAFVQASERLSLLDLRKDIKAHSTREFGIPLVFRRIWEDLALAALLGSEMSEVETEFDLPEAIFNMVLNRLSDPSSKRQLETWQKSVEGIESFGLHQYYRALDYLVDHKVTLEKRIFSRMRDLFHADVDVILFDTTTVAYYGDSDKHEDLLEYGFSKIRRGDLKQIVVGVIMSKQGIPLGHEVFEGNRNDVTCFSEIINQVSDKYKVDKVIMVGDRGMVSKDNIRHLEEKNYKYILGYRMRTIPQEDRYKIFSEKEFRKLKNVELQFKEATYNGKRLIVCYSEERAEKDRLHRENILEKIKDKIKSGNLSSIVDNTHYKRFLRIRGEKPVIDMDKVKRDAIYDGMFVLTTNTNQSAVSVVEAYKDLWQVELAFRQLKSELEMGPIYHWKDRRIRAHVMICFLAFVLRTVFYKKLKKKDRNVSYTAIMADVKALRTCEVSVKGEKIKLRTELEPGAVKAFRAIGMRPPSHLLSKVTLEGVVIRQ
jgi:transposase